MSLWDLLFKAFVAWLLSVFAIGCAQNVEPLQRTDTASAQAQPQDTANRDNVFYFFNGDMPPSVVRVIEYTRMMAGEPAVTSSAASTQPATNTVTDEDASVAQAARATHAQNNTFIFRPWGDSSQSGRAEASARQDTAATQDIRAAIELLLQLQAAGIGQQGGTAGQATEGGTADTTGGAMSQDAKLDLMIDLLRARLATQPGE